VNNCSYEREFCNKGITNPHGVFSGIARHSIKVVYLSIYLWFYSTSGPWPLFQFLNPIHSR
jgi:hypothetical protein